MGRENRLGKIENWIIAVGAVAVLGVFAALRFDYYYDLNDDVADERHSGRSLHRNAGGA